MEAALALRSVERSVEEVLLPSLSEIGERHGFDSAPWAFAARWASDWLVRAQRLAPPPLRPSAILVGDATRDELDFDALSLRSLQLFCVRSGVRVLVLPVSGVAGLSDVLDAFGPQVVVIAGADAARRRASRAGPTASARPPARCRRALPPRHAARRAPLRAACPGRPARPTGELLHLLDGRVEPARRPRRRSTSRHAAGMRTGGRVSRAGRPQLVALPGYGERQPDVLFCGHCGDVPEQGGTDVATRVCDRCSLGLLIAAPADAVPAADAPFLLVDSAALRSARCRAMAERCSASARPRRSTATSPSCSVPADCEGAGPESLVQPAAARRPRRGRGAQASCCAPRASSASASGRKIGPCGPPRAAVVTLSDGSRR